VGAGDLSEEPAGPVSVGTVFDRFPASVRGAVVVRAQDHEPHQIRLLAVRVAQAHDLAKDVHRAGVEEATVDVAPHREVLIPFDVPFADLGPGWFCVVADIEVDGSLRMTGPKGGGKRFGVPWPAEEVRRLDLKPNLKVGKALVERIQSRSDRTEIRWRPPAQEPDAELRVSAGSRRLPAVEATDDRRSGTRVTVTHPVPRRSEQLTIELSGHGREKSSATLDLG
jgi:hypothetical protein